MYGSTYPENLMKTRSRVFFSEMWLTDGQANSGGNITLRVEIQAVGEISALCTYACNLTLSELVHCPSVVGLIVNTTLTATSVHMQEYLLIETLPAKPTFVCKHQHIPDNLMNLT